MARVPFAVAVSWGQTIPCKSLVFTWDQCVALNKADLGGSSNFFKKGCIVSCEHSLMYKIVISRVIVFLLAGLSDIVDDGAVPVAPLEGKCFSFLFITDNNNIFPAQ